MLSCDYCSKNKPKVVMFDECTCNDCKWKCFRSCENCNILKPIAVFIGSDKYCGECQIVMKKKCDNCKKKYSYYELDNGKYCDECQKIIMLKCDWCKNECIYSNFYYSKTRIMCKKCVINNVCSPLNQVLIKY